MTKKIVIFGAGGFGREVAWLISEINASLPVEDAWDLLGFVEESLERVGQDLNGIPILNLADAKFDFRETYAVIAIGGPKIKERAVNQATQLGFKFATLVHPDVRLDRKTVRIGEGCMICAGNILTVNIAVGEHVILNIDCTVGHDCVIEDFVTISPGCHLSGHTTLRRGAYIGTGAVTVEGHEIGPGAVIGAGAVVVRDIPANVTAIGIPAKPIN